MKNTLQSAIFLLFAALICTLAPSCSEQTKASKPIEEITGHSSTILSDQDIVVIFNSNNPLEITDQQELRKSISLSPKFDYNLDIDKNKITIKPKERLKSKSEYRVKIGLKGVIKDYSTEEYIFYVNVPEPSIKAINASYSRSGSDRRATITGSIESSDFIPLERVKKGLELQGCNTEPEWSSESELIHTFRISLQEQDKEYKVTLSADYSSFAKHTKWEESFNIYPKSLFGVVGESVGENPQRVIITFSEAIGKKEDIKNYVTIDNGYSYKYKVSDDKLILYPKESLEGDHTINISANLSSSEAKQMDKEYKRVITFKETKPSIAFVKGGNILPSTNDNKLLFKAFKYEKARVRIKRIYENNILQFFQNGNDFDQSYSLYNISRVIADTTLNLNYSAQMREPANYAIDLSSLIKSEQGAIYRVEINGVNPTQTLENDYYSDYYFGDWRTYEERSRNIFASDLGLIVKGEKSKYRIFCLDIPTVKAMGSVKVRLYNEVNQEIACGSTNSEGEVVLEVNEAATTVIAEKNGKKGYLKIDNNKALQINNFQTEGYSNESSEGAFIFGERGVWRPGDTLHITVVPTIGNSALEESQPVSAQLYNPRGQMVLSRVMLTENGFAAFEFPTKSDFITGRYEVVAKVGNNSFRKPVRIESIRPNRLITTIDLGRDFYRPKEISWPINIKWLHGMVGKELKYEVSAALNPLPFKAENYGKYEFNDIGSYSTTNEYLIQKGQTDESGNATVVWRENLREEELKKSNSLLKARVRIEAFEPSGEFSTSYSECIISPFDRYTGIYIPEEKSEWGDNFINPESNTKIEIISVTPDGKRSGEGDVRVSLYKVSDSWWWNSYRGGEASYTYDVNSSLVEERVISLQNGYCSFNYGWKGLGNGTYVVRVTDLTSGHRSAKMVYISDYATAKAENENGSTRLPISMPKSSYKIGEELLLRIPSGKATRALVSIEQGDKVIERHWINCSEGESQIKIPVTKEMFPNAFAFITLIQPHKSSANDAPLRLYGVAKFDVEDNGETRLEPVLNMPQTIEPKSNLKIEVREEKGKKMSYIIMVTDEGLLSLTNYKRPDIWGHVYRQKGLNVRTWDLYDKIIGAYGGRIEQLFAIGGDDELINNSATESKARRFKPIAKVLGPFQLKAKGKSEHTIYIPQYTGSLRVMAVALSEEKFGSSEKSVTVKAPIMVSTALPRRIATDEQITVPVTVISTDKNIKNAIVTLKTNEILEVKENKINLQLSGEGEEVVLFKVKAKSRSGIGIVEATVSASGKKNSQSTEIDIVNPMPSTTISKLITLNGGDSKEVHFALAGNPQNSSLKVELSTTPALNLEKRLNYLVTYPFGCIEQVTSSAFAQLSLYPLLSNEDGFKQAAERNIKQAINSFNKYQLGDGALSYWPGKGYASKWGTIYAAHFLIMADEAGYYVPDNLKKSLLRKVAQYANERNGFSIVTPYANYILALNGSANRSSLNTLRENLEKLSNEGKWLVASSYAVAGYGSTARKTIEEIKERSNDRESERYTDLFSPYFESSERELAIIVKCLNTLISNSALAAYKESYQQEAAVMVRRLSEMLNDNERYISTQGTAWALNAVGEFNKGMAEGKIDCAVTIGQEREQIESSEKIAIANLSLKGVTKEIVPITIHNRDEAALFCNIISTGVADKGKEREFSNGITLSVRYYNLNGEEISPAKMNQGDNFYSEVTIENNSVSENYTNLALDQRFASGWEIIGRGEDNMESMEEMDGYSVIGGGNIDYQDRRDDRIYTFFSLPKSSKIKIRSYLKATYKGRFYLPGAYCEAMYTNRVSAAKRGMWIEIK